MASVLLPCFCSCLLTPFDKVSCYVVSCSLESAMWHRYDGGLLPTAAKDLNPANNWSVSLESDLSQLNLEIATGSVHTWIIAYETP